jgi:spoIIIJ-associated protein
MEFLEFEGKTTEEAIAQACAHFQLPPESLDIEIVSVGSPGLFGLGGRKARVRVVLSRAEGEGEADADLLPLCPTPMHCWCASWS